MAKFLCRIQVRSDAHRELDGAWFRAFDYERWGYWEPAEVRRQAVIIGLAAESLGGEAWAERAAGLGRLGQPGPEGGGRVNMEAA